MTNMAGALKRYIQILMALYSYRMGNKCTVNLEIDHHNDVVGDYAIVGGLFDFIKVWPDEHKAIDPFRK